MYKLFTRDFGLIFAKATSVRKLESKLRAHLQSARMVQVTLVKGKEIWRITGGEEMPSITFLCKDAVILLERFVRGEGTQKRLFDHVHTLIQQSSFDERISRLLLYYLILVDLGYADARLIGAETIAEYISWSIDDLYTQLILTKDIVRPHVMNVLSEIQL